METAVLLSGGVDSSLALHLLHRAGHTLRAFYLKIWLEDELAFLGDCPWEEDLDYARRVCAQLEVPLEIVPLQTAYREKVVEHALAELRRGRTPSPDIFCNQQIKFGAFFDRIGPNFAQVASGHYAQKTQIGDLHYLRRAPDPVKDQTYFLSYLSQAQLSRILFPVGHLQKAQVRQLALEADLPSQARKDSQGICFLGKISYPDFVRFHLGQKPGAIVERETGKKLGPHRGVWFHTIGQRHGLGLSGGPWFVVEKDLENNTLFVSHQKADRNRDTLSVGQLNWIAAPPDKPDLQVKLRHGPEIVDCHIETNDDGLLNLTLAQPDAGIAPGQHTVFYDGEICLGGGIIA
jgi:tRNA (5-methylaminomethyl-2-thiouridylate)-methyltransferase